MSLVSIIIPAYNVQQYLREAVLSAQKQTHPNIEIIIIDDASTDATGAIADKLATIDSRIRVIHHKENKFRSGALNTGIHHARGDYISFLDADDLYMPEKTAKQVAYLETHPDVAMVYGDFRMMYADREYERRIRAVEFTPRIRKKLVDIAKKSKQGKHLTIRECNVFNKRYIPSCSPLIRREVFNVVRLDESMRVVEDYDLWLQIIGSGFTMARMPMVTYRYRRHTGQITKETKAMRDGRTQARAKQRSGAYLRTT